MRPHFNSVFDLRIDNSDYCLENFVISGKVTSLPKVIKYVKRRKYSFQDFSAKHTPMLLQTNLEIITGGARSRLIGALYFNRMQIKWGDIWHNKICICSIPNLRWLFLVERNILFYRQINIILPHKNVFLFHYNGLMWYIHV